MHLLTEVFICFTVRVSRLMKRFSTIQTLPVWSLGLFLTITSLESNAAYLPGDANLFYAQIGSLYDSNVFRVAGLEKVPSSYHASKLSDLITVGTLGGQYQQNWGRQSVQLGGSYNQNTYANYSGLNYKSWDVNSALNWQILSQISGVFHYNDKQEQPTLNLSNQIGRDVIRTKSSGVDFSWNPVSSWEFDSGYQHTIMRHQVQSSLDFNQDAVSAAGWYVTQKGSRIGLLVEQGDITYPAQQVGNADYAYRQTKQKLQFEWPATTKLFFKAMVGKQNIHFKPDGMSDRNHSMQDVSLLWRADQKTNMTIGYQSQPLEPGLSTADVVNKSWYLLAKSKLSEKLILDGSLRDSKLYYLSSGVQVNTRSYRLALQWMPWRIWQIETYGQLSQRKSGFVDDSYDVKQLGLNLRYSF